MRAYVGRTPEGDGFSGYVTDSATESGPLYEGGPWRSVDDALAWARARADRVILTYAYSGDGVFSAGLRYDDGGDPARPLRIWPPDDSTRRELDREVAEAKVVRGPAPSGDQLGVTEPEVTP